MLMKRLAFWALFTIVWIALLYYTFFALGFVFGIGRDSSDQDVHVFGIVILIIEVIILLAGFAYIFLRLRRYFCGRQNPQQ